MKTKTRPSVTLACRSIFDDPKKFSRRPVWVRTYKGKEFLNKNFQDMLRDEGIQFQVCRNPDVKCAFVERAQRTVACDRFGRPRHMEENEPASAPHSRCQGQI